MSNIKNKIAYLTTNPGNATEQDVSELIEELHSVEKKFKAYKKKATAKKKTGKRTSTLKYRRPQAYEEMETIFDDVVLGSEWYVDPKDCVLYIACLGEKRHRYRWTSKLVPSGRSWWQFWKPKKLDEGSSKITTYRDPIGFISELDLIEIESCCDGG